MKPNLKGIGQKAGKAAIKLIPLAGNIIDNVESERGGKGKVDWQGLAYSVVRLALTLLAGKYGVDLVI